MSPNKYDEANEKFYQAVARLHDGLYDLLLIDGELAALQQRQDQLSIIDSRLTITNFVRGLSLTPLCKQRKNRRHCF